MINQMTIREIRKVLFETEKYTVIGADEMTNKESRDFLGLCVRFLPTRMFKVSTNVKGKK
jgi:hypothetical protein